MKFCAQLPCWFKYGRLSKYRWILGNVLMYNSTRVHVEFVPSQHFILIFQELLTTGELLRRSRPGTPEQSLKSRPKTVNGIDNYNPYRCTGAINCHDSSCASERRIRT